jgi:transposase
MNNHSVIGVDLSKQVFEVCVQDAEGHVKERRRLSRSTVLSWFAQQPSARVGMEACGGAHYWARELTARGHDVRILPPQYVKPFVRGNKSDAHDAQAVARALREPDMACVPIADRDQQDLQALHRMRQRLVAERTALVNQMRGFLLEYGIALPVGIDRAREGVRALLAKRPEALSTVFLEMLQDQFSELLHRDERIGFYTQRIAAGVAADPAGVRVREVLGIGVLTASALLIKLRHAGVYRNGRHFAASLGLVPRHEGTGGDVRVKGMSKRGDQYLRTLLIHGARAAIRHVGKRTDPLGQWARRVADRRGVNKAAVALASKHARIAWRLITHGEEYQPNKAARKPSAPAPIAA